MILAMPPAPPPAPAGFIQGEHAFAADLYKASKSPAGNLFLSPASVRLALAMTAAGALGDTEAEMQSVLHLGKDEKKTNATFERLLQEWSARATPPLPANAGEWERAQAKHDAIELRVVNRLWGQSGYKMLPAFLDTLATSYRAPIEQLDFAHALDASALRINAWVAEQTANKIQNLIPPGTLTKDVRLVLTNAIYFKAAWSEPFSERQTIDADFFGAKTTRAKTMQQTGHFNYGEKDGAKLLELPYADGSMSMVIVLPDARDGLAAIESSLSGDRFDAWLAALHLERVRVSLPRFKVESSFSLGDALQAMGMKSAFHFGPANFSRIDGSRDFFIGEVLHKAFIDLNEEGTEAAAATAVAMRAGAAMVKQAPPKEFKADHPFFFFIRDHMSGAILFAGRLVDPG